MTIIASTITAITMSMPVPSIESPGIETLQKVCHILPYIEVGA